jgi:hypothetical protein
VCSRPWSLVSVPRRLSCISGQSLLCRSQAARPDALPSSGRYAQRVARSASCRPVNTPPNRVRAGHRGASSWRPVAICARAITARPLEVNAVAVRVFAYGVTDRLQPNRHGAASRHQLSSARKNVASAGRNSSRAHVGVSRRPDRSDQIVAYVSGNGNCPVEAPSARGCVSVAARFSVPARFSFSRRK